MDCLDLRNKIYIIRQKLRVSPNLFYGFPCISHVWHLQIQATMDGKGFVFWGFFFCLFLFRAAPMAHGCSQARGLIGATASGLRQSHSNVRSKPRLWPTPQLMATPDP